MKKVIIGIITLALLQGCTSNVKNKVEPAKKYPPFDVQNMDTTIKPGDDFFAYNAYKLSLEGKEAPKPIDGFTDYQRFFLSYA